MRFILVACFLSLLFISGCVSQPSSGPPERAPAQEKTCRTVFDEVPETKEQCNDVSLSEQVCSLRKLDYTVTRSPKVDLCIDDGECLGKPLGSCPFCAKAMTRCVMTIRNTEELKTGTWTVGANFTVTNFGFNKEPITRTIGPNQTADFDFNQIYTPDYPIYSAACSLAVASEPTIEECNEVTRTKTECRNVTSIAQKPREVCD